MAYIRKEDLINKIKPEQEDDYEHFISVANVRKILYNFIESVAEVDAVEVVRCEDCERHKNDFYCFFRKDDDFCSWGKRRIHE